MIRERERQNAEMQVIIAGMKRQVNEDNQSIHSKVDDVPEDGADFFDDDDWHLWWYWVELWIKIN